MIKVDDDIPPPNNYNSGLAQEYRKTLNSLRVNQSFEFERGDYKKVQNAVACVRRKSGYDKVFTFRQTASRVWRVK
jgi:hypothetical protein